MMRNTRPTVRQIAGTGVEDRVSLDIDRKSFLW